MKTAVKYILIGLVLFFSKQVYASQNTTGKISGTVIDLQTKESLTGVQVYIKDLAMGTTTNYDGSFTLENIPLGQFDIEIKMVGYRLEIIKNVEIKTTESKNLSIRLTPISYKTGEIVISASKMNSLVKDIPSAVYLIDQKEMEFCEKRNIQDVLKKVSGVYSEDRRHQESNLISFRGIGLHSHVTRGILILEDGIPINEAMGRSSFEGIDLENAESVEVLKGPVSALYGPNGITGVINVVSKEPSNEFSSNLKASYGSYNSQRLSGGVSGGLGAFNLGITGARYTSDGYMDRTKYTSNKVGFKLNTNQDYWGIFNFSADYVYSDSEHGGTLDSTQFTDRETISTNNFTGNVKDLMRFAFTHQKFWGSKTNLNTNFYYRSRYDEGHYRDSMFGKDDLFLFGGEVRLNTSFNVFNRENNLIAGLSIEREDGNTKVYSRGSENGEIGEMSEDGTSIYNMFGFYLQTQYELLGNLKLLAGIRYDVVQYDWADNFNTAEENSSADNSVSALSPKFGFTYNGLKDISIYGNIGKGFNPPQISELFSSTSNIPNPDLEPEHLTNYEIGIRGNIKNNINYQISFYTMDFKDQVIAGGDDPRALVYENIGKTTHKGFESAINFKLIKNIEVYLNHSFTQANFVDHADYNNNQIRKVPNHQFSIGINYTTNLGISATIDYKWNDEFYMDNYNISKYEGYSMLDAKLNYKWQNYFASINVNNVLDVNYATYTSYSLPSSYSAGGSTYYPGWPRNLTLTFGVSI